MPPGLRARIAADLRPVRPLSDPWRRVAALAPVGLTLLLGVPLGLYAVRSDAARLGPFLSWGLSVLQLLVAGAVAAAAFRDVVPGLAGGRAHWGVAAGVGAAAALAVTLVTWWASPAVAPADLWTRYTTGCFRLSVRDGVPVLIVLLALAARGLVARPAVVGGLCGLASGLASDAAWRMVCGVSEPSHVMAGHLGAILALTAAGAVLAPLALRLAWAAGAYRSFTPSSHSLK